MAFKKFISILLIASFVFGNFLGFVGSVNAQSSSVLTPVVPELQNWMIVPAMPAVPVIIVKDIPETVIEMAKPIVINQFLIPIIRKYIMGGGTSGNKFVSDWKGLLNDVPLSMAKRYIDANLKAYTRPSYQEVLRPYYQSMPTTASRGQMLKPTIDDSKMNIFNQDFVKGGGWNTWMELMAYPQNTFYGTMAMSNDLMREEQINQFQSLENSALAGDGMFHGLKEKPIAYHNGAPVAWNYIETVPNKVMYRAVEELIRASFEPLHASQSVIGLLTALFTSGMLWDIMNGFNWGGTLRTDYSSVMPSSFKKTSVAPSQCANGSCGTSQSNCSDNFNALKEQCLRHFSASSCVNTASYLAAMEQDCNEKGYAAFPAGADCSAIAEDNFYGFCAAQYANYLESLK